MPNGRLVSTFALVILLVSIALAIPAWSAESVLYPFGGSNGAFPYSGVINDSSGNLFGTTADGGVFAAGNVFELAYNGTTYTETTLYSFTGGSDGGYPTDALIMDAAGNLYGTTYFGGTGNCFGTNSGCGVVFELVKSSGYAEIVLYRFLGGIDGGAPFASLASDGSGNLYGTTTCGGSTVCINGTGNGVVFELVKSSGYSYVILHTFSGSTTDGANPSAPVILDASGNLYGTTELGGLSTCPSGCGVIFKLTKSTGYSETLLYSFTGGTHDGGQPLAPVTTDTSGNLYGTTTCGGSASCSGGNGVIYELSASGSFILLHAFSSTGKDGIGPRAGLTFDPAFSTLYGTAYSGGARNFGTAFRLSKSGASFTVLYSFKGGSDGAYPRSPLDFAAKGRCTSRCGIGTTLEGGPANEGIVFLLTSI